jgi:preprotein translocase subunit SecA
LRILSKSLSVVFGSRNKRIVRKLKKIVTKVNSFEGDFEKLTDVQLKDKTTEFKLRYQDGETLEQLLPEAFAVVREASKRTLGLRHFDVQLMGGIVLFQGEIAEMGTGEGKTLVSTLPTYLNALASKGVHIVTVNDYLAERDADWMRPVYDALGMSVGINLPEMSHAEKKEAYSQDITYGTNNEFGFDYLRDNMAFSVEEKVQRELNFAIIDEVDSILIDEARTPLIISGAAEDSSEIYRKVNEVIPQLTQQENKEAAGDYLLDEKNKQAFLSEEGHTHVEELLQKAGLIKEGESLYDASNIILMHHLNAALRAHKLFSCDVDYIVKDGEVIIIDEHTGRKMHGRRWSDGLHQAVEAKENANIQNENQTLASITFQNFFRLYNKLSGMTGTADTEAYEFHQIYGLEVVVVPTNKSIARKDNTDLVYMTTEEKFTAILEDVVDCQKRGQPALVGTVSIEVSELLSKFLKEKKIKHKVLNAKFQAKEAEIISQAGRPGTVTIATNMAGRGTDIVLGGNLEMELDELDNPNQEKIASVKADWQKRHEQVLAAGGLHVVGTERHESRRIDNQLRGRSGRQGDAGSSRFYLSLEDTLLRIFAADRIKGLMSRLGVEKGTALESGLLSRCIENAQRKVEAHNFDMRKQLLEYDDVANDQRQVVYQQRAQLMAMDDVSENINKMHDEVIAAVVEEYVPSQSVEEQWNIEGLEVALADQFSLKLTIQEWLAAGKVDVEEITAKVQAAHIEAIRAKEEIVGGEVLRNFEKSVLLQALDSHWKEHLAAMDHLRQGIHLRGYAQKNPKQEYKREAFNLFTQMLSVTRREVVSTLSIFEIRNEDDVDAVDEQRRQATNYQINFNTDDIENNLTSEFDALDDDGDTVQKVKVGRNEQCPCGSEKKYKYCHGTI